MVNGGLPSLRAWSSCGLRTTFGLANTRAIATTVTTKYHNALHSKNYALTAAPKTTSINDGHPDDYDDHFAYHSKAFAQTATAPQATLVHTADGGPTLIPDEFDPTAISELCAKTKWRLSRDVVINCGGRVGGVGMRYSLHTKIIILLTQPAIGNVRQEILVCVRHAIEIGSSLIRPTIMLRPKNLIKYQNGPVENIDYMFDLKLFDARLRKACPLLPLYKGQLKNMAENWRELAALEICLGKMAR